MCVAIICPTDTRPPLEVVQRCWMLNPDGGGIAYKNPHGKGIYFFKTQSLNEFKESIFNAPGPCVIHFRKTSVGNPELKLCHPFPIRKNNLFATEGTANSVLFQNGTIRPGSIFLKHRRHLDGIQFKPGWSDSATVARVLADLNKANRWETLSRLTPSRWVYFNRFAIKPFGKWHWKQGIYYSTLKWENGIETCV